MTVMHWQDELATEDQPPREIWHDGRKMHGWFERLRRKWRGEKANDSDLPEGTMDDIEAERSVVGRNALMRYHEIATDSASDDDFNVI